MGKPPRAVRSEPRRLPVAAPAQPGTGRGRHGCGPVARGRRWRGLMRWGSLLSALGACVMAGCSEPPRGNLKYLDQDQIRVENPSKDHALATGIGCGATMKEAEQRARDMSQFNLRRVTGDARYRVEFTRVREVPDPQQLCQELEARANPPLLR